MENRMDFKIEKLYGSRPLEQGAYNEGKVRIEILYHHRDYRQGPVPGGFVVKGSRGYCRAFMVDRYNDLFLSLHEIFKDALIATGFDYDLEKKLVTDTRLAVLSLPDPTIVNGTWIAPELLVRINLEIRRRPNNNFSYTTSIQSRPRPSMSIDAAVTESMAIQNWRTMPASESMIQSLERIRVGSTGATLEQDWSCVLCLENTVPDGGLKVIRLPCKHIFHEDCIVKWLTYRNSCPLCRSCV